MRQVYISCLCSIRGGMMTNFRGIELTTTYTHPDGVSGMTIAFVTIAKPIQPHLYRSHLKRIASYETRHLHVFYNAFLSKMIFLNQNIFLFLPLEGEF